jgi:para-aminobenzoate synthetase component 1
MEFFSETKGINPLALFFKLNETSQAPFSAFYRMNDKYLMCASPERFLKKSSRKIISQPIKGTARRGSNIGEDNEIKRSLLTNKKEQSENVMIVDLVRNDLSKTCNNVQVDKLCDISSFKQWHQLISTVSGEIRHDVHFVDVIKNTFPMGSMTGAPKIKAMQLIEQFEKTKRGLYSGAVGYITPSLSGENGQGGEVDFDFNVVIRSILYNQASGYLSFQVGSAITANSIPEKEYAECLLKAKGMFEALSIPQPKISEK